MSEPMAWLIALAIGFVVALLLINWKDAYLRAQRRRLQYLRRDAFTEERKARLVELQTRQPLTEEMREHVDESQRARLAAKLTGPWADGV